MTAPDLGERGLLDELELLFRETFALEAWGRLLVFLERGPKGNLVVADVHVEEVLDDAAVDRAFNSREAKLALPALAKATETLTLLASLDITETGGGTFVRTDDGIAFLPGNVRTPSRAFDARRESIAEQVRRKNEALIERLGVRSLEKIECDVHQGRFFVGREDGSVATGEAVLLGSFLRSKQSWVWGGHNPTLPDAARVLGRDLLDHVQDRSMWEISTPGFTTDEPTAWVLAALLVVDRDLAGLVRMELPEQGLVYLGLTPSRNSSAN